MTSIFKDCTERGLIRPPHFVRGSVQYEVITGSVAYGMSSDESDKDVYGWCIPDKETVFPHLGGEILGFGTQKQRFEQYQEHHIKHPTWQVDLSIYNIVKYFQLVMENNPNMVDSLFVPIECVVFMTPIGNLVRENRRVFLHKGYYYKAKGYAYSQLNKIRTKDKLENVVGNRVEIINKYGYDVKFAAHTVRLVNQAEQVLAEGDLDLRKNAEQLKSIRRGDWKLEEVHEYFNQKEKILDELYHKSELQHKPDEGKIKELLLTCLEKYYGNLKDCVLAESNADKALTEIRDVLTKNGY